MHEREKNKELNPQKQKNNRARYRKRYFIVEEYTEFLRKYLGTHRDITRIVFKIVGRIYKSIKNGATEEQIWAYINTLKKSNF